MMMPVLRVDGTGATRGRPIWRSIIGAAIFLIDVMAAHAAPAIVQIQPSYDVSKCLDIFGGSLQPKYGVDLFSCIPADPHESFAFRQIENGFYNIIPQNGGTLCLDANGISASNGTQLVQNICVGTPRQQWKIRENAGGTFSILTSDGSRSLSVEGVHATANRTRILVRPLVDEPESKFYLSGFYA